MTDSDRAQRNSNRVSELYLPLRPKAYAILRDLEGHQLRGRIQEAWRSPAEQLEAFRSGHTKLTYGLHNVTSRKGIREALAFDLIDDDYPLNPGRRFMLLLAASARAHGLETGIAWGLSPRFKAAIDQAIAQRNWYAPVKVSWDPCHVQVPLNRLQILATRTGWRPKL